MDQISKLNAALVSVPQELTVAAANFNLDFSLMKVEAPKEFLGVGECLSAHKRDEAEGGQSHVTARKLGALFEALVPPVPNLYQAYGKRASAVSSRSKSKSPNGFESGLFASQAGPDGTSIWAAATSGRGAIAIHLLACMLARIWKSHEAISLWAELVDRRKQEILDKYEGTNAIEIPSLMASKQGFSRQQLAFWDASARSWLQTADADRRLQQTQLMLIISNVRLPVNSKKDSYESVIEAWVSGMIAVDRLIQGIPQRVQNGAILLAMSSWHLYPDMEVLLEEVKHIKQHDELMNESLITISSQGASHNKEGVFWSLPLARMRYYSAPVTAERHIASKTSRVTIQEFWLIALGAIISQWEAFCPSVEKGCNLIIRLSQLVNEPKVSIKWLKFLADAAQKLTNGTEVDRLQSQQLLRLGLRWCRNVLNEVQSSPPTFFGLCKYSILQDFISDAETKLSIFREIASSLGVNSDKLLIRYREHVQPGTARYSSRHGLSYMFATVLPSDALQSTCSSSDTVPRVKRQRRDLQPTHARWIVVPKPQYTGKHCDSDCPCVDEEAIGVCSCSGLGYGCTFLCHKADGFDIPCPFWNVSLGEVSCDGNVCSCKFQGGPECPCAKAGSICTMFCHMNKEGMLHCNSSTTVLKLLKEKAERGHSCSTDRRCAGCYLPRLLQPIEDVGEKYVVIRSQEMTKPDYRSFELGINYKDEPVYGLLLGDVEGTAIFATAGAKVNQDNRGANGSDATIDEIGIFLSSPLLNTEKLRSYLGSWLVQHPTWDGNRQQQCSLEALVFATELYNTLQGATINVEVAGKPLYEALWAQQAGKFVPEAPRWTTENAREVSFELAESSTHQDLQAQQSGKFGEDALSLPENLGGVDDWPEYDHSSAFGSSPPSDNDDKSLAGRRIIANVDDRLSVSFACLAMMETGGFNIDPKLLHGVMALSYGDSIHVRSDMISDPYVCGTEQDICRVFGNLGRSEMAFLVPPSNPRLGRYDISSWRLVNHLPFDGNFEDKFQSMSLHLSFTDFELPIDVGARGLRDTLAILLESVVSANDGANHIGDLDINAMFRGDGLVMAPKCTHKSKSTEQLNAEKRFVSIDSWAEFLDLPETTGIFRADGNWQARLAAASAGVQLGKTLAILPPKPCLQCLNEIDTSQVDLIIA